MKSTRKRFIKHAGMAGMSLFIPSSISLIYRYFRNQPGYDVNHINGIRSFKQGLEKYFKRSVYHGTKPDVLILNANTVTEYDFVFLKYNREVSNAPIVVSLKDDTFMALDEEELREQVRILKDISQRHDVFIYSEKDIKEWFEEVNYTDAALLTRDQIKKIKRCGINNPIGEELYRPVSVVYMKKNIREYNENKGIV